MLPLEALKARNSCTAIHAKMWEKLRGVTGRNVNLGAKLETCRFAFHGYDKNVVSQHTCRMLRAYCTYYV